MTCSQCNEEISNPTDSIICSDSDCKLAYHYSCARLSSTVFQKFTIAQKKKWRCFKCKSAKKISNTKTKREVKENSDNCPEILTDFIVDVSEKLQFLMEIKEDIKNIKRDKKEIDENLKCIKLDNKEIKVDNNEIGLNITDNHKEIEKKLDCLTLIQKEIQELHGMFQKFDICIKEIKEDVKYVKLDNEKIKIVKEGTNIIDQNHEDRTKLEGISLIKDIIQQIKLDNDEIKEDIKCIKIDMEEIKIDNKEVKVNISLNHDEINKKLLECLTHVQDEMQQHQDIIKKTKIDYEVLKVVLKYIKKDNEEIKTHNNEIKVKISRSREEINKMLESVLDLHKTIQYLTDIVVQRNWEIEEINYCISLLEQNKNDEIKKISKEEEVSEHMFVKVAKKMGVQLKKEDIQVAHRLLKFRRDNLPERIIAQIVRKKKRDEILTARRKMVNNSQSVGLGSRVYILNKRNPEQEKQALEWIEAVLGEKFPAKDRYEDIIRDGQVLCRVMNKLSPNAVAKIHTSGSQFKMMENINNFPKAIQAYGVSDVDLFQTVDLFEKKDIGQVTTTLFALGRSTYLHPEWPGPWLGPKPSEEHKRNFTQQQLRSGESVIGLQAGFNKGATQAGQNFGAGRKILLGK